MNSGAVDTQNTTPRANLIVDTKAWRPRAPVGVTGLFCFFDMGIDWVGHVADFV